MGGLHTDTMKKNIECVFYQGVACISVFFFVSNNKGVVKSSYVFKWNRNTNKTIIAFIFAHTIKLSTGKDAIEFKPRQLVKRFV